MAQINARVWLDDGTSRFPESELSELRARPSTGLCMSGGGTRAMCAAIGYLRGLLELGLLDRLRYTSAVSGGSWASIPFTYWQRGTSDDCDLLGPILAPAALDKATLTADLPDTYLGACATSNFRDSLLARVLAEGPGQAWISAVGETFLAPWGLHRPEAPRSYTWSPSTRDAILARQAQLPGRSLCADDFLLARPNRPFSIANGVIVGPIVGGRLEDLELVNIEFTPLHVGSKTAQRITYTYHDGRAIERSVGGGLVEPIAFDAAGPGWLADAHQQTLTLEAPEALSDLAFTVGTSSSAFASTLASIAATPERVTGRAPTARYWPPRPGDVPTSSSWELGDGGCLDNYGLLPLLQRGVETIIVLVNTPTKLDIDWGPGSDAYKGHIDAYLPPLFGVHEQQKGIALHHNQVFPREELAELVTALQATKRGGGPLIAVREHKVLDNAWWGIRGGRSVRIAWVYLDRVPRFEADLPARTAQVIKLGQKHVLGGPFQEFPNYATMGQNALSLVRLTPAQVRLLANLCSWVVLDQRAAFESLLR